MKKQQTFPKNENSSKKAENTMGSTTGSLVRKIAQLSSNRDIENNKDYVSPIKMLQNEVVSSTERLKSEIKSCIFLM